MNLHQRHIVIGYLTSFHLHRIFLCVIAVERCSHGIVARLDISKEIATVVHVISEMSANYNTLGI